MVPVIISAVDTVGGCGGMIPVLGDILSAATDTSDLVGPVAIFVAEDSSTVVDNKKNRS